MNYMNNPPVTFAPLLHLIQQFHYGLRNITGAYDPVIEITLSSEVFDRLMAENKDSLLFYAKASVPDCAIVSGIKVKCERETL